jgi:hypothetical protein
MAISEADLDAFMEQIVQLFKPWQTISSAAKTLEGDPDRSQYWLLQISAADVPQTLRPGVTRNDLVIVGPPTMVSTDPKPGWTAKPSDLEPKWFEASVPLPARSEPTMVNTTVDGQPPVLRIEIPDSPIIPVHGGGG